MPNIVLLCDSLRSRRRSGLSDHWDLLLHLQPRSWTVQLPAVLSTPVRRSVGAGEQLTANIILRVKLNPPEIPPSSRNCLFLFDVCPLYEMSVSPPQSLLVLGIEIKIYLFHAGATELSCEPTFMIDQH